MSMMHRRVEIQLTALTALTTLVACSAPTWLAPRVDGQPAAAGTPTSAASAAALRLPPGMDARGEVVDPALVERGSGRAVTGVDQWRGEVLGTPAAGSRLAQVQVGMRLPDVVALIGTPSDQGAYVRGQPWLPALLGTGVYRHELLYRGAGRLVFAGGAAGDYADARLVWIIHSSAETGVRTAPR